MEPKNNTIYLAELYRQTGGDTDALVNMLDVGAAIGLEKDEAGTTAEDLIISGFVELKTLSGGIGITHQGLVELNMSPTGSVVENDLQLGEGPVLNDEGRVILEALLAEVKTWIPQVQLDYQRLEECIIDIKTIEVQLLSPNPKTGIIREALRSLSKPIAASDKGGLSGKLEQLLEK